MQHEYNKNTLEALSSHQDNFQWIFNAICLMSQMNTFLI